MISLYTPATGFPDLENIGTLPIFLDKWKSFRLHSIMPRIAKVCVEGYPHHITQRGNNKEKTFFDDEDKRFYLEVLQRYKDKYKMKILAYCLMENHVHILFPKKGGRPKKGNK